MEARKPINMHELKVIGIKVIAPPKQCGMNLVAALAHAKTIYDQIDVLDFAFNSWGEGGPLGTYKSPDPKSQVFFTDAVENEDNIWPEIKKLCYRGPVTKNRRYDKEPWFQRNIAIYILTWDVYEAWRTEYLKNNPRQTTKE